MSTSNDQATKAIEWAVERVSAAAQSGWWVDKLSQLTTSMPAYKSVVGGTAPAPTATNSNGTADEARRVATRAEATADALAARVKALEAEVAALKTHLEEAVGPSGEGDHKQHWWSRKA